MQLEKYSATDLVSKIHNRMTSPEYFRFRLFSRRFKLFRSTRSSCTSRNESAAVTEKWYGAHRSHLIRTPASAYLSSVLPPRDLPQVTQLPVGCHSLADPSPADISQSVNQSIRLPAISNRLLPIFIIISPCRLRSRPSFGGRRRVRPAVY